MTKTVLSALALVLAASCSRDYETTTGDGRASQALQALSARDEERVARCQASADACTERAPNEAAERACSRLSEHCADLQERLAEVRDPAVGCWRAVQECAAHTPEHAQCKRDPAECESAEEEVERERDPVVQCSARIEECLARVATLPEAAARSCDNIAAACERAAARGTAAPDAGDDEAQEEDESEDEDESELDGESDAGGPGGRGKAQPRGPRGVGRADAGAGG